MDAIMRLAESILRRFGIEEVTDNLRRIILGILVSAVVAVLGAALTIIIIQAILVWWLDVDSAFWDWGKWALLLALIYSYGTGVYKRGAVSIQPYEKGVAKLLGTWLDDSFDIPPGNSWWWPAPIGGVDNVDLRVRVLNRTRKDDSNPLMPGPIHVLSRDRIDINVALIARFRVVDKVNWLRQDDPIVAFRGIIDRATRWYITLVSDTELGEHRGLASQFISGRITAPELATRGMCSSDDAVNFGASVIDRAAEIGVEIVEVDVTDFDLPESVREANARISAERAEREFAMIQMEGRQEQSKLAISFLAGRIKALTTAKKGALNVAEATEVVFEAWRSASAEAGNLRRVEVLGSKGESHDISRAAALYALLQAEGFADASGGGKAA